MQLSITVGFRENWCCVGDNWARKHERSYGNSGCMAGLYSSSYSCRTSQNIRLKYWKQTSSKRATEIDLVSMVAKISKFSMTCLETKNCVADIAAGLRKAVDGRPGPVVFEIPLDIQSSVVDSMTVKFSENKKIAEQSVSGKTRAATEEISQALMTASRPLLVIGNGAKVARVHTQLRSLAESTGIPVAMTWPTLDLFEYDNELNAGRIGTVAKRFANITLQQSDLVIVLGCRLDPVLTAHNTNDLGSMPK